MKFSAYLHVLWRRKWIIVSLTGMIFLAAVLFVTQTTPVYTATATLRVLTCSASVGAWQDYDVSYAERLMGSYARIATSEPVLDEVRLRLDLDARPEVSVDVINTTELMTLTVEHDDPATAATIANTLAGLLVKRSSELYSGQSPTATDILLERLDQIDDELVDARRQQVSLLNEAPQDANRLAAIDQTIATKERLYADLLLQYEEVRTADEMRANRVYIVEPASVPDAPSKPNVMLTLLLGGLGGIGVGAGAALVVDHIDPRLHTVEQVTSETWLPVIGKIPLARGQQHAIFNHKSPQLEAFRRLQANIFTLAGAAPLHTMLVTSAGPQEGKSTVTANLAVALARRQQTVLVIDADLRRPKIHTLFDLPNTTGLSCVLQGSATLDEALQASDIDGISVLTSGPTPDVLDLLSSAPMAELLAQAAKQFSITLVDTPAYLAVMDAVPLVPQVDGVLLVIGLAQARRMDVLATTEQLQSADAGLLGTVVNRTAREPVNRYYD